MTSSRMKLIVVVAALALPACGNYSNEDLDFQLALPEDGELEAKLPQALILGNSAEYYTLTRRVVTEFNGMAVALVSLVDHVRKYSPTSRNGAERIWGPFADDKHPGWQMRVVMQRLDDPSVPPPGFVVSYTFQIRQSGGSFFNFMTGKYASSGNARRGDGSMQLLVNNARDNHYPVDDFNDLAQLDLEYHTRLNPMTVHMVIQNVELANTRQVVYDYAENADGSGQLNFDWMVDAVAAAAGSIDVTFTSRWLGSGAGRADAKTAKGLLVGTDCWGPNTVAVFVSRYNQSDSGNADLCVFSD